MKGSGLAAIIGLSVLAVSQAHGTIRYFRADLVGSQEVPPNASPATGFLECTLDDETGFVNVTAGGYSGLQSDSTNAHIHGPAGPGVNAGVVLQLIGPFGSTSGSLSGSGTLARAGFTTAELIDAMVAGETYVNVHSVNIPGGEIRGQLLEVPEPATACLLALGGCAVLRRRRRA
ncbi:MAG TPA: CHRD domain-containing protein [Phycisphaerae bacterium]|nr:CHRD domain-containing protein [Phycisphaerae bacterium]HOJ76288.1 CHRD domain-containing protein [Phycisphaerae bacterium]HOM52553.1 CHRD domain-containing protein [Phycisphaerae bacterium]HON68973.1 CHRD domain-containing protein [Phycisphaerae bacterium]HOQ85849.1 CHRD domain-containing protein [Phycisphaerae bacterium]